jgi:transcriptional regulator with XRE-family HTH domain
MINTAATSGAVPEWTLGDRLRKARRRVEHKQEEIAGLLRISTRSIANYEGDITTPSYLVVKEWAQVTGVDLDWLLTGEPEEHVRTVLLFQPAA